MCTCRHKLAKDPFLGGYDINDRSNLFLSLSPKFKCHYIPSAHRTLAEVTLRFLSCTSRMQPGEIMAREQAESVTPGAPGRAQAGHCQHCCNHSYKTTPQSSGISRSPHCHITWHTRPLKAPATILKSVGFLLKDFENLFP